MNTTDNNIAELKAISEASTKAYDAFYADYIAKKENIVRDIVTSEIPDLGSEFTFDADRSWSDGVQIRADINGWLRDIEVCHRLVGDSDNRQRRLTLEFDSLREITEEDEIAVKFIRVIGVLSHSLEKIEAAFAELPVGELRALQNKSEYDCAMYEAAVATRQSAEHEARKQEFAKLIKVGTKVNIGPRNRWSTTDEVRTIHKVMPKNIEFAETYGRTRISDLLENLASNKWKLVG